MADVAKCPFCLEWVRTASNLEPARVQCPICAAQFSSVELLEMQPPELLLLPDLPDPESEGETEGAAVAENSTVRPDAPSFCRPIKRGRSWNRRPARCKMSPRSWIPNRSAAVAFPARL